MNSIGNTLKEARAKKSLSLEDVQAKLKIHPRVLQLLEDDRFEKLPSPLFVKSFLKSYADFLEVNGEELVQAYEREGRRDPEQVLFIKPAELRHKEQQAAASPWKPYATVAGIALALAAVFGLMHVAKAWRHEHPSKPRAAKSATVKKTAAAVSSAPAAATVPAKTGKEWLRSVEQGNFPKIAKNEPLELTIHAIDNVWLRVTCDGKVLFQSILRRGTQERWTASQGIEIWTGNSSNMSLELNGRALGSPGKGVVKKMLVSRAGVKVPS